MDKNLDGRYNFKEVGVGGRIILKLALRKQLRQSTRDSCKERYQRRKMRTL